MTADKSARGSGRNGQGLGRDPLGANSEIGRKLKQLYDGVASEQVPDRFNDLLAELEKQDSQKSAQGNE